MEPSSKKNVALVKPKLRGVVHQNAALVALGAGIVLVWLAPSGRAAWAALAYASSVVVLFSVSAVYHRPTWTPKRRAMLRRFDHASIFVLIAGTYTPLCLLALPPHIGNKMLLFTWATALAGILKTIIWNTAPKWLSSIMYILAGWTIIPYVREMHHALGTLNLSLMVAGGLIYSIGAGVYALRRPNPSPDVFGYHEIFHVLTVVACALHFSVVLDVVRNADSIASLAAMAGAARHG